MLLLLDIELLKTIKVKDIITTPSGFVKVFQVLSIDSVSQLTITSVIISGKLPDVALVSPATSVIRRGAARGAEREAGCNCLTNHKLQGHQLR